MTEGGIFVTFVGRRLQRRRRWDGSKAVIVVIVRDGRFRDGKDECGSGSTKANILCGTGTVFLPLLVAARVGGHSADRILDVLRSFLLLYELAALNGLACLGSQYAPRWCAGILVSPCLYCCEYCLRSCLMSSLAKTQMIMCREAGSCLPTATSPISR